MGALIRHALGDRVLYWDPGSGRGFQLDADADPRAAELRASRMGLDADRSGWVVHRSRRVLGLPDEQVLWVPCPLERTAGGFPYRALPLGPALWAFWCDANDSRTVADLERRGHDVGAAVAALARLDVQAVQLWPQRVPAARLRHLEAPARPDHARTADQYGASGTTTLGAYHDAIGDAAVQFDDRETTVAHALALPHPGLAGVPYGRRLREALEARGFDTATTVEVGCGTGELAEAWGADARYVRVDLSPGLLRAQRARVPRSPGVVGDATRLPLRDASVGCLVSNEVLADLPSTPTSTGWDNTGARAMVAEVARVLAPGGRAYLSEFGVVDGEVEEARQLDHPEVAIAFGPLAAYARTLGLTAELVRLDDLLGLDLHAPQLARHSWEALRSLARSRGVALSARAWPPGTPELPWRVEGLEHTTLADEGPGPLVTRFWALLLST
ncbi:MAG: class I SAM-dependent methyltransferase [Alphaproteobacteria bacterium]|nr:class I SAM-dependent methyltransferase [Alphaproteobacteria bacterium]